VFENGEIATINHVSTADFINGAGPFMQYVTINFADGSTIIIKSQGTIGGADGKAKSSREQADSRGSRGLRPLKPSILQWKKEKLDLRDMVRELSPSPCLPSDY
jgi:hypothetical protein